MFLVEAMQITTTKVLLFLQANLVKDFYFNPKRHGLFGQLNTWGGGLIQSILEKRSVTPPNFILEQQTVSHMKAEVFS